MSIPQLHLEAFSRFAVPAEPAWVRNMIPTGVVGTYVLLRRGRPFYVGRSDHCLVSRLIGHEYLPRASHVVWEICRDPVQAFHREAYLYDDSRRLPGFLNRVHPARPAGHTGECPFCAITADHLRHLIPWWQDPETELANGAAKKFESAVPKAA